MERKRKPDAASGVEGSGKKPKLDSRGKSQQGRGCYDKCGRTHEGTCMAGSLGCFKCGRTSLVSRDCTTTTTTTISGPICFQCNQRGHKRSDCPSLAAARQVAVPAPATLRITDGRQGRTEVPVAKSRAF
ncbi:uncharacterized protein LOC128127794 [Lactuca sativa]|uniref:uncharacterized protein LOC128127794 n=1 Tax=Lactuca sativa TaxID=4236 RepID=UPI0022AE7BEC|nr:uncharacterized protein LOC128127794 [Lactuca sativa]